MATEPCLAVCRRAAATILPRNGWTLLVPETLATEAAALLAGVNLPTQAHAERACQQVYACTLYAAVLGANQAVAYRELHAYLYRIAVRQRPELAEDAAQEALLLIYRNVAACRNPGAFLKFAIYQLMTAFHRLSPRRPELSLDAPSHTSDEAQPLGETLADSRSIGREVEERALAADLLRWLRGVIEANPRARNQLLAVALKYLEGQEDAEIAAALATTVANVHVLRSRGLVKLRAEVDKLPATARFMRELHLER